MKFIKNIHKQVSYHSFNARLLYKELQSRGVKLSILEGTKYFIKASYYSHSEILYGVLTSALSFSTGTIVDDKYYTKQYLKSHGFCTSPGKVFTKDTLKQALNYAKTLGFPVVLKPTTGSHGDLLFLDIENEEELKKKINYLLKQPLGNGYYLIEKQYEGNEYRLFISNKGFFAAVARVPASIIGDGKHTIEELVIAENYKRMNPRVTCLCQIPLDAITIEKLKKQKCTPQSVLKKGEEKFLRKNSNVSTGGNCYEVTETVHSDFVKLAKEILSKLSNVSFVGIDLMCADITKPIDNYIICELNSTPGLSLHMMPEKGRAKNVASAIVDVLFPETI